MFGFMYSFLLIQHSMLKTFRFLGFTSTMMTHDSLYKMIKSDKPLSVKQCCLSQMGLYIVVLQVYMPRFTYAMPLFQKTESSSGCL